MRTITAALAVLAIAAPAADAAPDCPDAPAPDYLLQGQGTLESVIADDQGRLFFTNQESVRRLDSRGAEPVELLKLAAPGGLAWDGDGMLIVGTGNSFANGAAGDLTGPSGLLRVDPDTGASQPFASGLSMGNGLVRGPDGSFYASNDAGTNIDRIENGQTQRGWARVVSGNGLAVDSAGEYLYVAQTFQPAAIARVELANPQNVTTYVRATDPADLPAGLDGMTRDTADRLFVTANGTGQVWRVAGDPPQICVLLRGLPGFPDGPSAVATGHGTGDFPATSIYVVTFDGNLIELPGVAGG
jgi:sugar lactone lactonase YvrE